MNFLFFIIYDVVFIILSVWYIPFSIIKKKFSLKAFLERLSFVSSLDKGAGSIWVQAVSVGEVLAVKTLLSRLKKTFPYRIVVSTTTLTGKTVADKMYSSWADVIFFPFDITFVLMRVMKRINPKVFIAIETELWPNLFYRLKTQNVPVVILNGRISDKAYFRYTKIKFFTKRILSMCSYIGAQNDYYKKRFISIGAQAGKVHISGNIKFGSLKAEAGELSRFKKKYIKVLKGNSKYFLIAASTHSPEEKIILDIFKDLSSHFSLGLLIAPRHPERAKEIAKETLNYGFNPIMVSNFGNRSIKYSIKNVFILDTVGELFYFYSLCDVCFVGGSLIDYGGHNILEPIYFAKPVIFGPYMNNFREIEEAALDNKAAVKVKDSDELKYYIERIVSDQTFSKELSANASGVFKTQSDYLKKNIDVVTSYLRVPSN